MSLVDLLSEDETLNSAYAELRRSAQPLLDHWIPLRFQDWTVHHSPHAEATIDAAERCVIPATGYTTGRRRKLSPEDAFLILPSCWLHDVGMAVSERQLDDLLGTPGVFADSWEALQREAQALWEGEPDDAEWQRSLRAEFVRRYHHLIAAEMIRRGVIVEPGRRDEEPFEGRDRIDIVPDAASRYRSLIADICQSHGEPLDGWREGVVPTDRELPRVWSDAHPFYCAGVVRIADYLDADQERTPVALWATLRLRTRLSREEWSRHICTLTRTHDADQRIVRLEGECREPTVHYAIVDHADAIDSELRETQRLLRLVYGGDLELAVEGVQARVTPERTSDGPAYMPLRLQFRLEHDQIIRLLLNEQLWKSRIYGIRELLQNALDAVLARRELGEPGYEPTIQVRYLEEAEWPGATESAPVLEVEDNGVGMDENIVANYFARIGRSYYRSADFHRFFGPADELSFAPVSRFGIGILAAFMLGDEVCVATKRVSHAGLGTDRHPPGPIDLQATSNSDWLVARRGSAREPGTVVRVRLAPQVMEQLQQVFAEWPPAPSARVSPAAAVAWVSNYFLIGRPPGVHLELAEDPACAVGHLPEYDDRRSVLALPTLPATTSVDRELETTSGPRVHVRVALPDGVSPIGLPELLVYNGVAVNAVDSGFSMWRHRVWDSPPRGFPVCLTDPQHTLALSVDRLSMVQTAAFQDLRAQIRCWLAEEIHARIEGSVLPTWTAEGPRATALRHNLALLEPYAGDDEGARLAWGLSILDCGAWPDFLLVERKGAQGQRMPVHELADHIERIRPEKVTVAATTHWKSDAQWPKPWPLVAVATELVELSVWEHDIEDAERDVERDSAFTSACDAITSMLMGSVLAAAARIQREVGGPPFRETDRRLSVKTLSYDLRRAVRDDAGVRRRRQGSAGAGSMYDRPILARQERSRPVGVAEVDYEVLWDAARVETDPFDLEPRGLPADQAEDRNE